MLHQYGLMHMLFFLSHLVELLFGLALFFNALLFIPQTIKIIKEKNGQSVSFITFCGFIVIQFISVLYGVFKHDNILIIGYLLSMVACLSVLISAFIYRHNK